MLYIEDTGDHLLHITAKGTVTDLEYQLFMMELYQVFDRLERTPQFHDLNLIIDLEYLEHWDWKKAWKEMQFMQQHKKLFNKVAFIGHSKWEQLLAKMFGWMIKGKCQYFHALGDAKEWIDLEAA